MLLIQDDHNATCQHAIPRDMMSPMQLYIHANHAHTHLLLLPSHNHYYCKHAHFSTATPIENEIGGEE